MNLFNLFITPIQRGGLIMWLIFGVSIVAWFIGLGRLFYLKRYQMARDKFLKNLSAKEKQQVQPTGMLFFDKLLNRLQSECKDKDSFNNFFNELLIISFHELERGLSTMSAWITAAPLLGLLGTVTGMIHTFQVILKFGIDNPHLMTEGISIALLTTQAGLTVAFPAMLFHNHLVSKKNMLKTALLRDGEELIFRFRGKDKVQGAV